MWDHATFVSNCSRNLYYHWTTQPDIQGDPGHPVMENDFEIQGLALTQDYSARASATSAAVAPASTEEAAVMAASQYQYFNMYYPSTAAAASYASSSSSSSSYHHPHHNIHHPLTTQPPSLHHHLHQHHQQQQQQQMHQVHSVARWQNLIPSFPWIAPGWRAWGRNPRKRRDQILQRSVAEP